MIDIIKVFCCRRGFVDLEINVDVKQVVGDYLREILYTKWSSRKGHTPENRSLITPCDVRSTMGQVNYVQHVVILQFLA